MTTFLVHNKVRLALHELRPGTGRPLLLLHGLGERSPRRAPEHVSSWPGPVLALDFTGHGASTRPRGGGYSCELLMADVDVALAHLGEATLVGRGLGAYIALLVAGARPSLVRGAVLEDGPGLFGGAAGPTSAVVHVAAPPRTEDEPDPYALVELAVAPRTGDYALAYARHAVERSGLRQPFALVAHPRPAWLAAVAESLLLHPTTTQAALAAYAG